MKGGFNLRKWLSLSSWCLLSSRSVKAPIFFFGKKCRIPRGASKISIQHKIHDYFLGNISSLKTGCFCPLQLFCTSSFWCTVVASFHLHSYPESTWFSWWNVLCPRSTDQGLLIVQHYRVLIVLVAQRCWLHFVLRKGLNIFSFLWPQTPSFS